MSAASRLLVLVLAFAATPVRAQEIIVLREATPGCRLHGGLALRELLALELADAGAALGEEAPESSVRITLRTERCDTDHGEVEVALERAGVERRRVISVEGEDVDARARVLALAIAELVVGTRGATEGGAPAVQEIAPSAVLPAARAVALPAPLEVPADPPWSASLVLALGGAFYPDVMTGVGALRAGLRADARDEPWALEGGLRVASGVGGRDPESTHAHATALELAALALARLGPLRLGGGVEASAGVVWLWASDSGGTQRDWVEPLVTLAARASGTLALAPALELTLDLRGGVVATGAALRRGSSIVVGVSGPMVGLDVGLRLAL